MDNFKKTVPSSYVETLNDIPSLPKRPLQYVMEDLKIKHEPDDLWLEFGVFNGTSINYISNFTDGVVYGFDSFEGLPEDWRPGFEKGTFSTNKKLPNVNKNVVLIEGLFENTLDNFLNLHLNKKISFIHLDADLYSSTKYVLDKIKTRLKKGTVIVFDELINYPGYDEENGELLSWYEFITENDIKYEWIGMYGKIGDYNPATEKVALQII